EERIVEMMLANRAAFNAIAACPKPLIARINGHALGGGCELTLCCDYRIMVEDGRSKIGQSEQAHGIIPGGGGTQRLVPLPRRARALPLLYGSVALSGGQAEGLGLGNKGATPDGLAQVWDQLA